MTRRRTAAATASEWFSRDRRAIDLDAGTSEHYVDAILYDHEYRHRRADVNYYRQLARDVGAATILELGCGTGRVLVPLVRDGHRVVGLDRSATMLARAQARVLRLPRAARDRALLLQGDLRDFVFRRRFPLVIAPFNVIQHLYERADVLRFLASVRRSLEPGGLLAFDVLNPDLEWLTQDPRRRYARTVFRHPVSGKRVVYTTNQVYDPVRQVALMWIYYRELGNAAAHKREQVVRLTHRCFFPEELLALLEAGGFTLRARYGSFSRDRFVGTSESQVLECQVRS
jgi:SAM-dependent methyltransferase